MSRKSTPYGRKLARQTPWQRNRHASVNPMNEAIIKTKINTQIQQLRTASGLQAVFGDDAANTVNTAGRLVFIVAHAAGQHKLGDTPEARILAGTANALGDLAASPAELERQRGAITSGLEAIERLMPRLSTWALAAGALELDALLNSTSGMGTSDVRKALGMGATA
jgi:hypothetical protein